MGTSAALEAHRTAVEQLAGVTVKAVQKKQLLEEAVKALKEECASVQAQLVSVEGTVKSKDLHTNELALQTSELKQQLASQLGDADGLGQQNKKLELSLTTAN